MTFQSRLPLVKLICLHFMVFILALLITTRASAATGGIDVAGGTFSYTLTTASTACGFSGGHSTNTTETYTNFSFSMAGVSYTGAGPSVARRVISANNYGGTCVSSVSPTTANFTFTLPTQVCIINLWAATGSCEPTYLGYINPKYVVVGVTYAPPGPSSFVQYTSGTTLATTKSTTNSFSSGKTVSVTVSNGTGIKGWASGKVTVSNSNTVTQASSTSSSVTLSLGSQLATKTPGTPSAYSPLTHDYDIIWLWLNPVVLYTVMPSQPNSINWNGYGFDTTDQPAIDLWPVYVGYLNGDFGALDSEDAKVLARSWATGETWPAGQGPGLTQSDFSQILQADPFSNASYAVQLSTTASPATTTDGRFTISGGASGNAQDFIYKQANPGSSPITQTFSNTYSDNSVLGSTTTTTTVETFGIDVAFTSTIFIDQLFEDIKYSQTLTWTDMASTSTSSTATAIDALSITGPPCATSSFPCVPNYTGTAEFDVYQDNIYGTFMFNPAN